MLADASANGNSESLCSPLALLAAVAAMTTFNPGGWRGGATTLGGGSRARLATFYDGLSFAYPAQWQAHNKGAPIGFNANYAVVLTEHLHLTCTHPLPNHESCSLNNLEDLPRGSAFTTWTQNGLAEEQDAVRRAPGKLTRIGDQPAKILIEKPPATALNPAGCTTLLTVTVSAYSLRACTNGNDNHFKTNVLAMLRSVTFKH